MPFSDCFPPVLEDFMQHIVCVCLLATIRPKSGPNQAGEQTGPSKMLAIQSAGMVLMCPDISRRISEISAEFLDSHAIVWPASDTF